MEKSGKVGNTRRRYLRCGVKRGAATRSSILLVVLAAVASLYVSVTEVKAQAPNISCPGQWSNDGKGYRCVCGDGTIAEFHSGTMVCNATAPPTTDPNSIMWHFQNRTPYTIGLAFYSQERDYAWPGYNQAYNLLANNSQTFPLSCVAGEHICYGAWYMNDPTGIYWGAGFNREQGCQNCCYTCGSSPPLLPIDP